MTRRERAIARLERRREWAAKRDAESASRFAAARAATDGIPFGQPILVGHHSEKRHRAAIDRMARNMDAGCAAADMAKHHASKAAGIADQLDRTIFSDDPNACEALEAKARDLEAERDRRKAINAAFRKGGIEAVRAAFGDAVATRAATDMAHCHWETVPFPPYSLTNLGARIRDARKRIEEIKRQDALKAKAEAAPGGVLVEQVTGTDFVGNPIDHGRVTFPEYPGRETVAALKAAGWWWSAPSWVGKWSTLPESIRSLADNPNA